MTARGSGVVAPKTFAPISSSEVEDRGCIFERRRRLHGYLSPAGNCPTKIKSSLRDLGGRSISEAARLTESTCHRAVCVRPLNTHSGRRRDGFKG